MALDFKKILAVAMILLSGGMIVTAQSDNEVYLFSYFKDNGQDGLHLAYSLDGYTWKSLKRDSSI